MTVKVGIEGDPANIVSAFAKTEEAINRLRRAADEFAAMDLGHPELQALEDQLKRLTLAMQAMRVASGNGVVFTTGSHGQPVATPAPPPPPPPPGGIAPPPGYTGPPRNWGLPGAPAVVGAAPNYGAGSPPGPPAPPTPATPPAPPAPTPSGGGALGAVMGALSGPLGFALSLAGVSGLKSVGGQAVGQGEDESIGNDRLLRTLRDSTGEFDKLRNSVREAAGGIGATFGDTQAMALRYARTAGSDVGSVIDQVKFAANVARGYGIDQSTMADMQARGENAGINSQQFAVTAGDATREGGLAGRTEEVMRALLKWSEGASRVLVSGNQMGEFARMYTGLNATGYAGFRGQNAEALIGTINSSLTGGGNAGMASQVFTYRALAAQGVKDPFAQQYVLSGGMFARTSERGGSNMTVFDATMAEARREYAGQSPDRMYYGVGRHLGLNSRQVEALVQHYKPGEIGRTQSLLQGYGLDLSKVNASGLADIGETAGASEGKLNEIRKRSLPGMSAAEQERIRGLSGEALREGLIRNFAERGMNSTEGSALVDANAHLSNAMTDLGSKLVGPLTDVKEALAKLGSIFDRGIDVFGHLLNTGHGGVDADGGNTGSGRSGNSTGDGTGGLQMNDGSTGYTSIGYRTRAGIGGFGFPGRGSGYGGRPGAGPQQAPLSGTALGNRTQQAMDYFERQGWSHEAAAGIVANLIKESGLREGAIGDGGSARGLMQWHGDRFADVAGGIGMDPTSSFEAGLAGVQYELTRGHDAGMLATGQYMRGRHSAAENGAYFSMHGERPGDKWGAAADRAGLSDGIARMPSSGGTARIEPLRVIHMLPNGRVLRTQTLPVQIVHRPTTTEL